MAKVAQKKTATPAPAKATKAAKVAKVAAVPPIALGTGRRKASVAQVKLYRNGSGQITVNGDDYMKYFPTDLTRLDAASPLRVISHAKMYDYKVKVSGGGKMGQADATKLGISRALVQHDESFRPALRDHDLLTVDSRLKERKKYGRKGARRGFQFVKR